MIGTGDADMKKNYEQPEAELIRLTAKGVITESVPGMEEDELTPILFGEGG